MPLPSSDLENLEVVTNPVNIRTILERQLAA
jgi:hypothetical protein